jgi:hypothetical protein
MSVGVWDIFFAVHTESEFEKYQIVQDRLFESDFDRVVAETKRLGRGEPEALAGKASDSAPPTRTGAPHTKKRQHD